MVAKKTLKMKKSVEDAKKQVELKSVSVVETSDNDNEDDSSSDEKPEDDNEEQVNDEENDDDEEENDDDEEENDDDEEENDEEENDEDEDQNDEDEDQNEVKEETKAVAKKETKSNFMNDLIEKIKAVSKFDKFEEAAKSLMNDDAKSLAKAMSFIANNCPAEPPKAKMAAKVIYTQGSKLTGRDDYTAYIFTTNIEINNKGYLFKALKRNIPEELVNMIENVHQICDKKGFVFDLPSAQDEKFQGSWQDGKFDVMDLLEGDLPDLFEEDKSFRAPSGGRGGFERGRGGRGGFERGRGRGGFERGRGRGGFEGGRGRGGFERGRGRGGFEGGRGRGGFEGGRGRGGFEGGRGRGGFERGRGGNDRGNKRPFNGENRSDAKVMRTE